MNIEKNFFKFKVCNIIIFLLVLVACELKDPSNSHVEYSSYRLALDSNEEVNSFISDVEFENFRQENKILDGIIDVHITLNEQFDELPENQRNELLYEIARVNSSDDEFIIHAIFFESKENKYVLNMQ